MGKGYLLISSILHQNLKLLIHVVRENGENFKYKKILGTAKDEA